ncbi:MAG: hypothetical protein E6Q97_20395 [Desulfurellales bacterium]|nr:MAG: hypothetical protein E6Q97_20395 [Desulfurellales bacterium]
MSISIEVPLDGDGPSVSVSSIPRPRTFHFTAPTENSIRVEVSFDEVVWVPLFQMTGGNEEPRTTEQGFDFVRAVRVNGADPATLLVGPGGASVLSGPPGAAATVAVGTTTTGAPGSLASVTNAGSSSAAILNFTLPRGDTGASGAAATVAVGTTTTGAPGSLASVTNAGSSSAAILNFTLPRGDTGASGTPGVALAAGASTSGTASGTNWFYPYNSETSPSTGARYAPSPFSAPFTISRVKLFNNGAMSGAGTWNIILQVNGVDTVAQIAGSANATPAGLLQATFAPVTINPTDYWGVKISRVGPIITGMTAPQVVFVP